jgi:RNA polymerase sigma-70 factor (ECF subfamily)
MMQPATALDPTSDESLAERARRGMHDAFETLVARHQDRIYRLAMRMSRNSSDAEEIAQETFLRAHCAIATFRGKSCFGTWLYRIAMNEALMRKRAAERRPTRSLDAMDEAIGERFEDVGRIVACRGEPWSSAEDLLERKRLTQRVRDALNELDEPSQAALVLRDLEELSAEEAAEILATTTEAVRQRAHRARLKLRERLASHR